MGEALKQVSTISLATDNRNLFSPDSGIYVNAQSHGIEWERPVSVELINPDGSNGFHIDAGLRIRGDTAEPAVSANTHSDCFSVKKYGESKLNYPLFEDEGVKSFDKIDLRCAQNYSWSKGGWRRKSHCIPSPAMSSPVIYKAKWDNSIPEPVLSPLP